YPITDVTGSLTAYIGTTYQYKSIKQLLDTSVNGFYTTYVDKGVPDTPDSLDNLRGTIQLQSNHVWGILTGELTKVSYYVGGTCWNRKGLNSTLADIMITQQATYVDSGGNTQPLIDDGNPLGRQTIQAVAIDTGTDSNVMPAAIVNPVNSIDGFYAVINLQAATGGTDAETDDVLRQRILANRQSAENSTPNGIQTAIKNLTGVTDVRLVNNNTMGTDSYGNPPKSVHLYVIGGDDSQNFSKVL
ncbi:hypothetical protein HMPREF0497_1457, partial [Lentilactobacillus buchneri ATCC 11577]